jgi:glyoxylase-like metal-dependent hydrolase (beta-lactamase superfamily II)
MRATIFLNRLLTVFALVGVGCAGLAASQASAQTLPAAAAGPPGLTPAMLAAMNKRRMVHLTGGLYEVQYGGINTVQQMVYVTADGIILTDTEDAQKAQWLKDQLAQRFPGKSVRYIVLSHWHFDHARGLEVFPEAKVITSDEIVKKIRSLNFRYAPPAGESIDLNGDNRIDRSEAKTSLKGGFDRFDTDKDGFIEPQEVLVGIRMPDLTFTGRKTLTLGGRHVELIERPGRSGGVGGMVDTYFPDEKVLFVNDYMPPHRVYPAWANFDNAPLSEWLAAIRQLNSLDYLMYVSAHWENGTKQDLQNFGQFLQDINTAVLEGIAEGRSLDELQHTIPPSLDASYKEWAGYDENLPANIAGAYNAVTLYRDCASMGLGLPASKPGPGVSRGAVCYYGAGAVKTP